MERFKKFNELEIGDEIYELVNGVIRRHEVVGVNVNEGDLILRPLNGKRTCVIGLNKDEWDKTELRDGWTTGIAKPDKENDLQAMKEKDRVTAIERIAIIDNYDEPSFDKCMTMYRLIKNEKFHDVCKAYNTDDVSAIVAIVGDAIHNMKTDSIIDLRIYAMSHTFGEVCGRCNGNPARAAKCMWTLRNEAAKQAIKLGFERVFGESLYPYESEADCEKNEKDDRKVDAGEIFKSEECESKAVSKMSEVLCEFEIGKKLNLPDHLVAGMVFDILKKFNWFQIAQYEFAEWRAKHF